MLNFEDVSFTYEGAQAPVLKNISFQVEEKSFVSIIGASGSGKSTIFRLLNGFEKPQTGHISIDGTDISSAGRYAGYMPQQDLLFPWRTVRANVELPMQIQKMPKAQRRENAEEMLKQVGLLEWADRYPRELSGGMRQRVSFARTLCTGTDLMLLDEPFSALDFITRISLQEWIRSQWAELGKTIIFITHDVEEAIFLSQKVLVLCGRPVDEIREFKIPLPDKRDRDMLLQPEIEELKETLIEMLRSEAEE